jgi:hypothetical protein
MSDDELGYPDGIYQYIHKMYFLHSLNVSTALYYGHKKGAFFAFLLSLSSYNYWRYPLLNSTRRKIDLVVSRFVVPYHIYLSFFTTNTLICSGPLIFGSIMYPVSIVFYNKQKYKMGAFCHCLLHICSMIGACFTYRDYYLQNILR